MSEDDLRTTIKATVQEVLTSFGFDTQNLHEVQRDFVYLRKVRTGNEKFYNGFRNMILIIPIYIVLDWCKQKIWGKP